MLNAALLLLGLLSTDADSVLKRGKTVPAGPAITIGQILADPAQYSAEEVGGDRGTGDQVVHQDGVLDAAGRRAGCQGGAGRLSR